MCGVAIEVPLSSSPSLPVPELAEKVCRPGAPTSGLRNPSAGVPPREVNEAILSVLGRSTIFAPCGVPARKLKPNVAVTGVPATSAARIASAPVLLTSVTGITLLPVMPAEKRSALLPKTEPSAPASAALPLRFTEPQRRVVSTSSHSRKAYLPATAAASATLNGSHPSRLAGSLSFTNWPVLFGLLR